MNFFQGFSVNCLVTRVDPFGISCIEALVSPCIDVIYNIIYELNACYICIPSSHEC